MAIKTEKQYQATLKWIAEFNKSIEKHDSMVDPDDGSVHPILQDAVRAGLVSKLKDLESEAKAWEELLDLRRRLNDGYNITVADLFDKLYLEIAHGDDEHRKWLKNKIDDFKKRYTNEGGEDKG